MGDVRRRIGSAHEIEGQTQGDRAGGRDQKDAQGVSGAKHGGLLSTNVLVD